MEIDTLLADGKVAAVHLFRYGVEAIGKIEVDKGRLLVLHFVKSGSLLKLTA